MPIEHATPAQPMEVLNFPLYGSRLIEASAGTGKTFTLALLYIRLILGRAGEADEVPDDSVLPDGQTLADSPVLAEDQARPLTPRDILVVTFTEAATEELRDRIRQRLVEAAACFGETSFAETGLGETGDGEVDVAGVGSAETAHDAGLSTDDPLVRLRAAYPQAQWSTCAWRLKLAAEAMDEARIHTIHGWCHRVLREHAFRTRGLFERTLLTDQHAMLTLLVQDYWRQHFYPLSEAQAALVQTCLAGPDQLLAQLRPLLGPHAQGVSYAGRPLPAPDLAALLGQAEQAQIRHQQRAQQQAERLQAAQACWQAHWDEVEAVLWSLQPHLSGTHHASAQTAKFEALLGDIKRWAFDRQPAPKLLPNFAQGAFRFKKTAKVQAAPEHPAFQALAAVYAQEASESGGLLEGDRLEDDLLEQAPLSAWLLAHAHQWVTRQRQRRMAEQAEMSFDDLLTELDHALDPAQGEAAQALAQALRAQAPVAMIDEFQDTDPLQYRIFDRIYQVAAPHPGTTLIMIGDPKQAIYSFRGADIQTYLKAREATAGRHYTLSRNFRSTQAVVSACNGLFEWAEQWSRGAFRFRLAESTDNPIPFVPVSAQGRQEQLKLAGVPVSPLNVWYFDQDDEPVSKGRYLTLAAQAAAATLSEALAHQASGFEGPEGWQPLVAADVAILVRNRQEAEAMREALSALSVPSVYLSDRESVLATPEAHDLVFWLRACAEPNNERRVRQALGTPTLAISLAQLAQWRDDELAWESQMQQFALLHQVWRRHGVLAMLRQLMAAYDLSGRLLATTGGERVLTNVLHLAEWLQHAAMELEGEQALIRYLAEHLDQADEQQILRLESDAQRVRIITIHKSKGLEYPLVMLPFICTWREVNGRVGQVMWRLPEGDRFYPEGGRFYEVAGPKHFAQAWMEADDQRLSEDMRLLYVALTRARHALWLGLAPLKSGNARKPQLAKSAIGYLLQGGGSFESAEAVRSALSALEAALGDLVTEVSPPAGQPLTMTSAPPLTDARTVRQLRWPDWWVASYSALELGRKEDHAAPLNEAVRPDGTSYLEPENAREDQAREYLLNDPQLNALRLIDSQALGTPVQAAQGGSQGPAPSRALHDLPRGSLYGTFLHDLLEWMAQQTIQQAGESLSGYQAALQMPEARRDMLARRCQRRGLVEWIEPLDQWLSDFLTQQWGLPEAETPFVLGHLQAPALSVEMEFMLESHQVSAEVLDRMVTPVTFEGASRPPVLRKQLNGMLKGFIDLVFEHEGRYYVADWKSNALGDDDQAYTPAAMQQAMLDKRYDLQAILYLVALHRQLHYRLPDYDYDQHIGGAVYVFLRGYRSEWGGRFMWKPPRALIEALDALFRGEPPVAEVTQMEMPL
ncbi:exodeoxyribonuclease V subunit beta [Terasakiispira papahanaumokuakeensis]|uniref:RecBCD enzyme subunit RecB n=1 Tax=Terasakiispira papahanaumokuakeensis TaxID=197479 RepID=A0A1E2V7U2_9GAMM|nr:exodeoxyribonuclease V subunit beta [Terasakiispira papahanaumokuakeensis]ODC02983.1 exodeoxyribonuclease V subunit beta [Terasakiispira papahanaumokuakeensis]